MAYQKLKFRITGDRPLLMHNGQLANPLSDFSKAIKKVSGKRNKTDADYEELSRLEFRGGLWLHNGEPCIPSEALEACFTAGARKTKQGKQAQAGVIVREHAPLEYKGPKDPDKLWKDKDHVLVSMVKIQRNKIARTRPIFKEWSCTFDLEFRDDLMNEEVVVDIMKTAGEICGLGDWIPKFGLFSIKKI